MNARKFKRQQDKQIIRISKRHSEDQNLTFLIPPESIVALCLWAFDMHPTSYSFVEPPHSPEKVRVALEAFYEDHKNAVVMAGIALKVKFETPGVAAARTVVKNALRDDHERAVQP